MSITELFNNVLEKYPNKVAFGYLADCKTIDYSLTFQDFFKQTCILAQHLSQFDYGSRAIIATSDPIKFLQIFAACILARIIAVPVSLSGNKWVHSSVPYIIDDCNATIGITTKSEYEQLKLNELNVQNHVSWLFADNLNETNSSISEFLNNKGQIGDTVFLQYTSGSTSMPKGVEISHENLLYSQTWVSDIYYSDSNDYLINWLPLFHDMGLIVCLNAIVRGATTYFLPANRVIRSPLLWLEAISKYKGTVTGAPNFAFKWCVDKIQDSKINSLDLSTLKVLFSGGEPIDALMIKKFMNKFKKYNLSETSFYPCYGLAEATAGVTSYIHEELYDTLSVDRKALSYGLIEVSKCQEMSIELVSCGKVHKEEELLIVNPKSNEPLATQKVGEIWLSGPQIGKRYWGKDQATNKVFNAYSKCGKGPYLKTGDMGFIYENNLYIAGRMKDVIISHGRNFYASDIENKISPIISEYKCLMSAAISVENKLVILISVRNNKGLNESNAISQQIRKIIWESFYLVVTEICYVESNQITVTSSGKIQRNIIKNNYLEKNIKHIHKDHIRLEKIESTNIIDRNDTVKEITPRPQLINEYEVPISGIEKEIALIWQNALMINPIGLHDNLFDLGCSSLESIMIAENMSAKFNIDFGPILLFEAPNIYATSKIIEKLSGKFNDEQKAKYSIGKNRRKRMIKHTRITENKYE